VDEDSDDVQISTVARNVICNNRQLHALMDLMTKVHELLMTNAILNGHGSPGGGGAPGSGMVSSLHPGITKAVNKVAVSFVFFYVNAYFVLEDIVLRVISDQNLDSSKSGLLTSVRAHVTSLVPSTASNMRAKFLRRLYLNLQPTTGEQTLMILDAYILSPEAGHVAGKRMSKTALVTFAGIADFNGELALLKAIRVCLDHYQVAGNKMFISPSLLACVLVSIVMKKNLVSDPFSPFTNEMTLG